MRGIGRLIAVLTTGMIVSVVVAAVAAVSAKRHLVPVDDPEADEVQLVAIFDQLAFRSDARSFRGGSVDCWFGGGQIVVPESWRVVNDIVVIAGGVGDMRTPADRPDDAPELRLEGVAAFGGFAIVSELPAGAEQALFQSPA